MAFSTGGGDDSVLSEINITPLVDVMLVLLVAFIITAPLLNNAVRIELPKTEAAATAEPNKDVTLSIDGDQRFYIDKREITRESLNSELKLLAVREEVSVNLQADGELPYSIVAKTITQIEQSGIRKIAVLTTPSR
jgi:biopolymer transport protein ExbD